MIQLKITGMTCDSCAMHVKDARREPGVRAASVSYPKAQAEVESDPHVTVEALTTAVARVGYGARPAGTSTPPAGLLDKARGWFGAGAQREGANCRCTSP